MNLIGGIVREASEWSALRRDLHAHPELGFEEHRTSERVAECLTRQGIEVHRGLAATGVIGLVHGRDGGASGRLVGLRADSAPSMGAIFGVQVPGRAGHSEASEAQLREGD